MLTCFNSLQVDYQLLNFQKNMQVNSSFNSLQVDYQQNFLQIYTFFNSTSFNSLQVDYQLCSYLCSIGYLSCVSIPYRQTINLPSSFLERILHISVSIPYRQTINSIQPFSIISYFNQFQFLIGRLSTSLNFSMPLPCLASFNSLQVDYQLSLVLNLPTHLLLVSIPYRQTINQTSVYHE